MADEETVDVLISGTQRVRYSQYRKITKADYEKYLEMCEQRARDDDFDDAFGHLFNLNDVLDADEIEDIEIELDDSTAES